MNKYKQSLLSGAITLALGLSTSVIADTTTSDIKGQITGPQGNAAAGTVVTITHVPSGTTKTAVVNNAGIFSAHNLRIGGPYKVTIDSDKFEDQTVSNVYLTLGETYPLNVSLNNARDEDTIVVTGQRISEFSGGTGPASHFDADDLENAPAINRDIKDMIRQDPRIYVDESQSDAIQCGGGNPRYNSLTLDGVRLNDSFGLNSNGYPTERMPFSYDSIEQVSVELAPFDVKYGGFTSCNINAVTKSGGNEIKGGVFFDYTNDSMTGDTIEGDDSYASGDFSEKRYGFNVGGPIIEDELFFFVSYEKLEGAQIFAYNPLGNNISQAEIDRIVQISQDVYGYDAGGMPGSLPVEDEKLMFKIDWNINQDHRASFIYNYNDGFSLSQSDSWALTLDSHFYERGAELKSYVGSLYSDWTMNFSTEVRVQKTELVNRQLSLDAASGFGEVQIRHGGTTVFLGPDDSRQTNLLYWDNMSFKLAGTYLLDEHTITMGYEHEELTAFNLFMQHTQGEFRFGSIDEYEAGFADRVYYNNSAGTNVPTDASQEFAFALHTFYVQDEYTFLDEDIIVQFGLRYDKYTSDDNPRYNAQFETRYGIRNDASMDGIDLLQPRFGLNWRVDDNLEIRGGIGLYSGGNPNVWISNAYSNDGLVQVGMRYNDVDLLTTPMTNGGTPGFEIPQGLYDDIGALPVGGGDGSVNAIDPNFEIPSEWKYSIGATYTTDDDYIFSVDLLHNRKQDSATIVDLGLRYTGETTLADGRPLIEEIEYRRNGDYLLTNSAVDGKSTILSFAANKEFDSGFEATLGYSYTKSEDANPMTSAVAGSNYGNLAATDPLNPGLATSNYEIPHRFTMSLSYRTELYQDYGTRFSLFGSASEGQPYSFTYDYSDRGFGDQNWNGNRQLLYVPLENDPNVTYDAGFDQQAFNDFIAAEGLTRGKVAGRNDFNADWSTRLDLRINQEIPGILDGHRGNAYFVIKNLGNFLDDDWGTIKTGQFVGSRMVDVDVNDDGSYTYNDFNAGNEELDIYPRGSLWQIRIGVNYKF